MAGQAGGKGVGVMGPNMATCECCATELIEYMRPLGNRGQQICADCIEYEWRELKKVAFKTLKQARRLKALGKAAAEIKRARGVA